MERFHDLRGFRSNSPHLLEGIGDNSATLEHDIDKRETASVRPRPGPFYGSSLEFTLAGLAGKGLQISSDFACKDFRRRSGCEFYGTLTTLAHHYVMKTRDNRVVIGGLQRDHGLLAAYLEATHRIDWRPLHKRTVIAGAPEPVNVEAHTASTAPQFSKVVPSTPFDFRRANLVRASGKTQLAADGVRPRTRSAKRGY